MKQILFSRMQLTNAGTRYFHPSIVIKADGDITNGEALGQTTENSAVLIAPDAGTLTDLTINLSAAPGAGTSWVFTIRKNGANTSAVVTISETDTSGTSDEEVTIAAGDLISIQQEIGGGTPTNSVAQTSLEFEGNTTGYFGIYGGVRHTTQLSYNPLGIYQTEAFDRSTSGRNQSRLKIPISCTVREVRMVLSTAPGGATSKTIALSTVNSSTVADTAATVTVSGANTSGSTTGLSVSLSPDVSTHGLLLHVTFSGAPATSTIMYTFTCEAENNNSSIIFTTCGTRTNSDGYKPLIGASQAVTIGAAIDDILVGRQGFTLKNLYISGEASISSLDARIYYVQKNGGNTALSVDRAGLSFAENTTDAVAFAEGDDINLFVDHTNSNSGLSDYESAALEMFVPSGAPSNLPLMGVG